MISRSLPQMRRVSRLERERERERGGGKVASIVCVYQMLSHGVLSVSTGSDSDTTCLLVMVLIAICHD